MAKLIPVVIIILLSCTVISGCSRPEPVDTITGYIYLNGRAVAGARVEAVSADGSDLRNTTSDNSGAYTLSIKTDTLYNLTATCQGLRHTVWPVYLPGESNTYDIHLMAMPYSATEGSGYAWGGHSPWADHMKWAGVVVNMTSVKDNSTITALTDSEGRYHLDVAPEVLYNLTGAGSLENKYPIPSFHYRNTGTYIGPEGQLMVKPNETVLIDYEIRLP